MIGLLRKFLATLVLYSALIFMTGCGAGGTLPPAALPDATPLRGNWVVAGVLPVPGPVPPQFGLAMTIDVVSGQIIGNTSLTVPCAAALLVAVGGATKVEAAIPNSDGTFVLEDALLGQATTHQFVIHGTLPKALGDSWSGTYVVTNPNPGCTPIEGSFTAAPFQPISGTYVGTSKFSGTSQVLKVSLTVQQGGSVIGNVPGAIATSQNVIGGTIQVQGSPCFTSGTIRSNYAALLGNYLTAEFTMDDGSIVSIAADVSALDSSTLSSTHLVVEGGACDKSSWPFGVVFRRQ